jgi:uncharacterized protein YkwD
MLIDTETLNLTVDFPGCQKLGCEERLLYELVNRERLKAGLPLLLLDLRLVELARLKSDEMFKNSYFNHISPTYGTPINMLRNHGISSRVMGAENIARAATVRRAHQLFMDSKPHRANIMDPQHDSFGVGVYKSMHGVVVTQLFLGH